MDVNPLTVIIGFPLVGLVGWIWFAALAKAFGYLIGVN